MLHAQKTLSVSSVDRLKTLAPTIDFTRGHGIIEAKYKNTVSAMRTVVEAASNRVQGKPREWLSDDTLQMLATRKALTHVARNMMNQAIRHRVGNDYHEYATRKAR